MKRNNPTYPTYLARLAYPTHLAYPSYHRIRFISSMLIVSLLR